MKKIDLIRHLETGKAVLAKHGTWGLYIYSIREDGSIGMSYKGRINPRTAELLVEKNPEYLSK